MLVYIISGVALGFSAAVTPGPFQAYLLNQTVNHGWKRALPVCLAPLISDGPIIFVFVILLARTPEWILQAVKIGGGLFLLFLAYEAGQTYRKFQPEMPLRRHTPQVNLLKAAFINASGPGPYIFWGLIAGPILMEGWRTAPLVGISFLSGFYATLIGGFGGFVLLFGLARSLGPRVNRILVGVSALALSLFGISTLFQGITSII